MAFPTLSSNPYQVEIVDEFSTIATPFEAGYQHTRERHTRNRKTITARYRLTKSDRDAVLSHYATVRGSVAFDWTDPESAAAYTVRYVEAPKVPIDGAWPDGYEMTLKMREV